MSNYNEPKSPTNWGKILKFLGFSWMVFSIIAGMVFGSKLSQQFTPPVVQKEVLDYGPYDKEKQIIETTRHIALFRIEGAISGTGPENSAWIRQTCREIDKAGEDPNVKAILLEINSPGGEVAAADSVYQAVKRASKTKPVVAYFGTLAASGGYYIGCAANTIITHPESLTGSIGVILQSTNYAKAFEKIGVEIHTFKSGKFKDMLNGARPLEIPESEYTQKIVNQTYEGFLGLVAENRKLDPNELRKEAADGRILKGTDAVDLKLADRTGEFRDAIEEARKQGGAEKCNVVLYQINTHKSGSLLSLLGKAPENIQIEIKPGIAMQSTAGTTWAVPAGVPLMLHLP